MRLRLFALALVLGSMAAPLQAAEDVKVAALIGLARISRDTGDPVAAARHFEQARALRPLSPAENAEYFWILTKVDARRALGVAYEVLKSTPADDNVRDAAIGAALTFNDEAAVAALAGDGIRSGRDQTRWHRRLGESHARAGRSADAANAYLAAGANADGQPADWLNAAVALTGAERYVEAVAAWKRVPPNVLVSRPEHARLRLLAMAKGAPASEAVPEIMSWLATNHDREVQGWLVESWVAARNFSAAYAAALSMATGPDRDRWLRRAAEFARRAGRAGDAADVYEQLVNAGRPTRADHVVLIDLWLTLGEPVRALQAADALARTLTTCDAQVLSQIDRLPQPAATDRLRAAVERWNCPAAPWGQRVIERSVAESRFDIALAAVERFTQQTPQGQRLHGELLLWTGSPAAALTLLEPYIAAHPSDVEGRLALIDAMRAVGRLEEAFAAASPLYSNAALPSDRIISLGELAMNAGQPRVAAATIGALDVTELTPAAGLILVDATIASGGYDTALTVLPRLPLDLPSWRAVALRALTVKIVTGATAGAANLRAQVCAIEAEECEAAEAAAFHVLVDSWRTGRSPASLERVTAYADRHSGGANVRAMAAELLLETGQAERARTMLTANTAALSRSGQVILARALADIAGAHHRAGREREALQMARGALIHDVANFLAWRAAFDAAVALGADEAATLAREFAPVAAQNTPLLLGIGDHVAGLVQPSRDTAARAVIGMIEAAARDRHVDTNLTQARLYAALDDWDPAMRTLDAKLRIDPKSPDALRLRADVLGWSGQHLAALTAYDDYLKTSPQDVAAQRQQARVAGWASRYADANQRYAALVRRYPTNQAIAAEAAAKHAFYAGRWHQAIVAYDAWIALEPGDSEARFERTMALRSAGAPAAADAALTDLAAQTGHRLAGLALSQSQDIRRPTAAVVNDLRSASGFEGTRLLSMQQQRGLLTVPFSHGTGRVSLSAGHVRAESDARAEPGYRAEASTHLALSSRAALDGGAGVWMFSSRATAEGTAAMTFSGNDRVTFTGGLTQQAVQENLTTVSSALTARGPFASVRLATPKASFETRATWQRLSDDNTRSEVTVSASRMVSERVQGFRVVAWGQSLGYGAARTGYFSPDAFVRIDGGAEFTRLLRRPRFAGDRFSSVTVAFVEGTDNHGVLYHHPTMTTHLQLSRRVALNGRAEVIRSSTYRESSLFVGLDLANLGNRP